MRHHSDVVVDVSAHTHDDDDDDVWSKGKREIVKKVEARLDRGKSDTFIAV